MPDGNAKKPLTVIIAVMSTILTIVAGVLITGVLKASDKAEEASKDVLRHDGAAEAHPTLQERTAGNHEKIQIQLGHMDEKIDRVLDAVEK